MDQFNLPDVSQDTLYGVGSVIAGIYYGFSKFFSKKKEENVDVQSVEAELISILRQHVKDESEKNKGQQQEIKDLNKNIDDLEIDIFKMKKIISLYDSIFHYIKKNYPEIDLSKLSQIDDLHDN